MDGAGGTRPKTTERQEFADIGFDHIRLLKTDSTSHFARTPVMSAARVRGNRFAGSPSMGGLYQMAGAGATRNESGLIKLKQA
jgi:hypothetical protein